MGVAIAAGITEAGDQSACPSYIRVSLVSSVQDIRGFSAVVAIESSPRSLMSFFSISLIRQALILPILQPGIQLRPLQALETSYPVIEWYSLDLYRNYHRRVDVERSSRSDANSFLYLAESLPPVTWVLQQ